LAGLVALLSPIHDEVAALRPTPPSQEQLSSFRAIARLSRRESESQGASSIRGDQMNFGGPSASGFADGLWPVFLKAPVPSGCTLTMVLSKDTASI